VIYRPTLESTWTAGTARASCTHLSCKTKAPRTLQPTPLPPLNNPTPEQAFLSKNYDENARRADRDPRGIFRTPTDASAPAPGIVGPLGSSSFSLPTVERALAEMEGASAGATLGGGLRRAGAPTSPTLGSAPSPTQHEVLQNFFKSLLNPKDRAASPGTSAVSPGAGGTAAAAKPAATGPRTSSGSTGGGASGSGESQTDADADTGSGVEDG